MVFYLLLAFAFLVVFILTAFNKIEKKDVPAKAQKRFKFTLMIISGANAFGMILFMIAELVEVLYTPFNIMSALILVASVVFYLVENYYYKQDVFEASKESINQNIKESE